MLCETGHKKACLIQTALLLISLLLTGWMFGNPTSGISQERFLVSSPLNPAFLAQTPSMKANGVYQRSTADGPLTPEGRRLGYKASPVDLSHLKELSEDSGVIRGRQRLGLPSSFDLRDEGKLTSVRDQGNCGSCWAFATYGSLESNLLPSESENLSENHLKNTHGFDWDHCIDGGNAYISAAYLGRWSGPVREMDDPYDPVSGVSPPGLSPLKHIQEILLIPDRSKSSDNDRIKEAVMSYGAVYTSMYWGGYYNGTTHAYYFSGSTYSNHAVAIVGWDDNYSRHNFSTVPPGDGAFIVRNSWGTAWGEDGYFYISYYDSNIGTETFVFRGAESTANYSRIYQYDPLGWVISVGYGKRSAWFANVFTAEADEELSAVSFYTASPNSKFSLYIYKNAAGGPRDGTLERRVNGKIASAGYHTVSTGSPIFLPRGQTFSVVVKLRTPKYDYPIPVESPMNNYSSLATANSGESYVSPNGKDWSDLQDIYSNANVCLKAFTVGGPEAADPHP